METRQLRVPVAEKRGMTQTIRVLLVCAGGWITTLAAALLVLVIRDATSVDFFSVFHCVVVPSGAIGIGIVAASGYYAGARLVHQPPTYLVGAAMIAGALGAQLLLYVLSYLEVARYDGDALRFVSGFPIFVGHYVTGASFHVRGTEVGEVGALGWVLVGLQCIGLAIGGLAVLGWLALTPWCERCRRYDRPIGRHVRYLHPETAQMYKAAAFADEVGSSDHRDHLLALPRPTARWAGGMPWRLTLELRRCAGCGAERWRQRMERAPHGSWEPAGHERERVLPVGSGLEALLGELKRRG